MAIEAEGGEGGQERRMGRWRQAKARSAKLRAAALACGLLLLACALASGVGELAGSKAPAGREAKAK